MNDFCVCQCTTWWWQVPTLPWLLCWLYGRRSAGLYSGNSTCVCVCVCAIICVIRMHLNCWRLCEYASMAVWFHVCQHLLQSRHWKPVKGSGLVCYTLSLIVKVVSRLLTTALSQDHLVYNITSALRKAFGSPSQSIRTQKRSVNKPLSELCSKNEDQVLKIWPCPGELQHFHASHLEQITQLPTFNLALMKIAKNWI